MNYLIWQIFTCLLVAGLFGLFLGWILWGSAVRRLRQSSLETELKLSHLTPLPAKLSELEAKYSSLIVEREAEAARMASRDLELEQLRMSIFESDARHRTELSQKEAQVATLMGRVAELEPMAAARLVPTTAGASEMQATIEGTSNNGDQAVTLLGRIDELEPLAARIPVLESQLTQHQEAHEAKDNRIADQDAELYSLRGRMAELEPLANRVPSLESNLAAHSNELATYVDLRAAKDEHIDLLAGRLSELELLVGRIPDLEASLQTKSNEIANHVAIQTKKDQHIESLIGRISQLEPLATAYSASLARIAELETLAARERTIEQPKAMAAVAGSFSPTSPMTSNSISELPEPDTHQPVLSCAKSTELTQMRRVLEELFAPINQNDIAHRAFMFGEHRCFRNGTPQEDWLKAERQILEHRLSSARQSLQTQGLL